ncbi:1-deoxy-D-xylulose-5-phosphate synthase N-terminal domain-containing protein [Vibrio sp. M60_M31a]
MSLVRYSKSSGFNYIGPIDGHDVNELVQTLKNMRELKGPQFLHIMTKKGKGYEPAEKDPIGYHGVPKFDPTHDCLPKAAVASQRSQKSLVTSCVTWPRKILS